MDFNAFFRSLPHDSIERSETPYNKYSSYYAHGGSINPTTGAGTQSDHRRGMQWVPTRFSTRSFLEVLYNESWSVTKFIDIPVDDMMVRWREFNDPSQDQAQAQAMMEQEALYQIQDRMGRAMKAGRLHGTGVIIPVTREAPLDTPFDIERIRPGDLINFLVFDRWDLTVDTWESAFLNPNYAKPITYRVSPLFGEPFIVHHTRVIRFDGKVPLSDSGFSIYERDWGVSEVVSFMDQVVDDETISKAAAHMISETSLPVFKVQGMRRATTGDVDEEDATPEQVGNMISRLKSVYRAIFIDKADDFGRVDVNWAGVPEIMDRYAARMAAAADIPATRFWGKSPVGMNATGDSDMQNYALMVAAMQKKKLTDPLTRIDQLLLRNAGLAGVKPLTYSWPKLIDVGDVDLATASELRARAANQAVMGGIITEDDANESLKKHDDLFSGVKNKAPGLPEDEPPGGEGGGGE